MQYILFILLALIPTITTLRCYVCNSVENPACNDPSTLETYAQECPRLDDPYCRKIQQTVNKEKSIVRSCGSKTGTKACYKTAGANNANVCSCNTDLCNTAAIFNTKHQQMMTIFSSFVVLAITMIVLR